jgi:hypothetical protein
MGKKKTVQKPGIVEVTEIKKKTTVELAADLADIKRVDLELKEDAKDVAYRMGILKDSIIGNVMIEKKVKSQIELESLFFPQPDKSVLEIRAVHNDAPVTTYDPKTTQKIEEYEATIAACRKEIEVAKTAGKVTVVHHYTRAWQVWLNKPESPRAKVERAIRGTSKKNTDAWGWDKTDTATLDAHDVDPLDTPDIGGIQRIHLHVENVFKTRVTDKVVEVHKIASAIVMNFDVAAMTATSANEILMAVRAKETNDFQYKWASGAYYWILNVNNLKMRSGPKGVAKMGAEIPVYTIVGSCIYDSTRTEVDTTYLKNAVAVKISDGSTYA